MDGVLRAGAQVAQLDPLVIISAMAVCYSSRYLSISTNNDRLLQIQSHLV